MCDPLVDPKNSQDPFSPAEDSKLISLHAELGNKWAQIARLMPGRAEQVVKGRWRALARATEKRGGIPGASSGIGMATPRLSTSDGRNWCGESLLLAMADGPPEPVTPHRSGSGSEGTEQPQQYYSSTYIVNIYTRIYLLFY